MSIQRGFKSHSAQGSLLTVVQTIWGVKDLTRGGGGVVHVQGNKRLNPCTLQPHHAPSFYFLNVLILLMWDHS